MEPLVNILSNLFSNAIWAAIVYIVSIALKKVMWFKSGSGHIEKNKKTQWSQIIRPLFSENFDLNFNELKHIKIKNFVIQFQLYYNNKNYIPFL